MPPPKNSHILTYSLVNHPRLGYLIEPYAVKLSPDDQPTLTHKRLYSHTIDSYFPEATELDKSIVELATEYSAETLGKKYNKKKTLRPTEFLLKVEDEILENYIIPIVQRKTDEILNMLIGQRDLYVKGSNDNPMQRKISLATTPASILFHFRKENEGTRYYPTIKHDGERVNFLRKECHIICNEPCWFLVNDKLFHFDQSVEGKKLLPFFDKDYIDVSPKNEALYFNKFILPLIERYPVQTHGFPVHEKKSMPSPVISLERSLNGAWTFCIQYEYKEKRFYRDSAKLCFARLSDNSYPEKGFFEVEKLFRNFSKEDHYFDILEKAGLEIYSGSELKLSGCKGERGTSAELEEYLAWLNNHYTFLENKGFNIETGNSKDDYFIGPAELQYKVSDKNDWFDIEAEVVFGKHRIPFVKLKDNIINGIRELKLPDGKIAILPGEWFSNLKELFLFGEKNRENSIRINKYHYRILQGLPGQENGKNTDFQKKLQKLDRTGSKTKFSKPANIRANLRPYQTEGVKWLMDLREIGLGGCLADDMGLGKTLQTLSLISKIKEDCLKNNETYPPSVIIMPASLIHNWANEIKKFAPELTFLKYTGIDRKEMTDMIPRTDIILTTYGTMRNDIDEFKEYYFHYVILDESQNIKNPNSKIAKTVRQLQSDNKLVLTGTPIENSLTDLWSQMHFINPGLLGNYKFFKQQYAVPIEKKKDEVVRENLQRLIHPFILRRTKSQVAKDLPTLTEKTHFCEMTPEQEREYEKIKSSYRNQILKNIEQHGINKSQFMILRGLTQLRLVANHPKMLGSSAKANSSGKFDEVINMLENVLEEGHKVLIYSQFVKHLNLFRKHFDATGITYNYLTGSTRDREKEVSLFMEDKNISVFLISLKAGGSGLNLMAADYVFLLDPWWNPAVEQQAINRAHRIGQDKKVFSYKFITKNTIEEKIVSLQERKTELSESLIHPTRLMGGALNVEEVKELLE